MFIANTTTPQIEAQTSEIDSKITEVVKCEIQEVPVKLVSVSEPAKISEALNKEHSVPTELNLK